MTLTIAASAFTAVLSPGWRDELRAQVGYGPPDRYKCYEAATKSKSSAADVELSDAFESRRSTVGKLVLFCAPADQNGEGITAPELGYACHEIADAASAGKQAKFPGTTITAVNELGESTVEVKTGRLLCLPTSVTGDA